MKKAVPRALTKCFYIAFHAWLMLYPRYLNIDWGSKKYIYMPSLRCVATDICITASSSSTPSRTPAIWPR